MKARGHGITTMAADAVSLIRCVLSLVLFQDDLQPFIRELLLYHPGLEFLEAHPDFHPKYATTVTTRIFYIVNTR